VRFGIPLFQSFSLLNQFFPGLRPGLSPVALSGQWEGAPQQIRKLFWSHPEEHFLQTDPNTCCVGGGSSAAGIELASGGREVGRRVSGCGGSTRGSRPLESVIDMKVFNGGRGRDLRSSFVRGRETRAQRGPASWGRAVAEANRLTCAAERHWQNQWHRARRLKRLDVNEVT
jgi:hypothetical protein